MEASQAFILAGKIGFYYHRKSIHSHAINEELARTLGSDVYKKFCSEIRNSENRINNFAARKYFMVEFLNRPITEKDRINDMEVHENYSLESLMKTLAKIVS